MKFGSSDRRLVGGLLVSLLLHALVLLLQFGVPGMGTPGSSAPLTVVIANVVAPPPPEPVPPPPPLLDAAVPPPAVKPAPVGGMRLVDPVPQPEAVPAAPAVKAKPKLKKGPPRRAKRISPPLPAHETLEQPTKVIAQDTTVNEFALPVVRPEEAEQKTVDVKEAQVGDDDGDADVSAALEAEAAKAGRLKAEEEAQAAAKLAEERARAVALAQEERKLAEQRSEQEAARLKAEQLAQQKLEQTAQLAAEQRRAELAKAEQQKSEQVRLEQQKAEQLRVEQKKAEQLRIEQQKAEQLRVEQQKLEQQRAEQQKLEQQRVEQQKLEQQRAEQQKLEQQRAEQQKLEQQRAEQQRAEQQRADRERAERQAAQAAAARDPVQPGSVGTGGRSATPGGAGADGAAGKLPRNILGSDLANRARDLVKGLDVLSGDPPGLRPRDGRRVAVGANERDVPLRMYVESWRQKIERNASVNYPRNWADEQKRDPLVSVAVRSDGSIEDVTIITSSGRADMDEAVRRIVRVNARYSAFPPDIAKKYDVIDIRRVWRFDDALKLMEEVR